MGIFYSISPKLWFKYQSLFLSPINDICSLTRQLSRSDKFQFFVTDPLRFEKIKRSLKDSPNESFIQFKIGDKKIFIVHSLSSFENILINFKKTLPRSLYNSTLSENLSISFYEIKRFSNKFIIELLKTKIKEISEDFEGIIINKPIIPAKVFYGSPPRLYKLPKKCSTKINSVKITLTPDNYISNIYIDTKHPNCDSIGFFCVKKTLRRKLDYDLVLEILENLKIYNFNGFYYYIPEDLDLENLERI